MKADDLQEILTIFKSESEHHLQKLNDGVLALEKEPGKREIVEEIFREAHSLKGAARMIGFETIEKVAHAMEDLFNETRKGKMLLTGALSDFVLEGLDLVNRIVNAKLRGRGEEDIPIGDYLRRSALLLQGQGQPSFVAHPRGEGAAARSASGSDRQPPETAGETGFGEGISVSVGARDDARRGLREAEERVKVRKRQSELEDVAPQYEETIRVSIDKLDELMAQ